ncbi:MULTISPECIES: 16S rRNA (guanine(966)-N(2))-methyltransferase RsmD [Moraxella]|uniref:Ribosomal RNA small subunit methyltransferase D n=1 Tax=Moraxella lacunata TaxID=477 RepID=A0A1B8PX56_MORLA|nr:MULTISPECIES: 16S rRNA (guanine(966)-N(2))-methyltransferase RsmD [Moraxella]MBE9578897.1 16S rRNA (guanine(966)-N(2))-methyltransferase RsmD [Moraxella sp. K1664]MBE9588241.1 16S rRNA (guanine(966)-N(2))-methyltransferase RsmD [Moraxella sp. K1630]MBE9590826.1 16S rRNA (guanine(966)-N(2))-methyltransferase RsmD [Moraxella sp. K127]MBE9596385.1 16S rRNA (guanine(966)-N(2))-methyltransferase RsmD [Moraxella sp. K2450]MDH9218746.1 16S rRNA (guanine(966)-N(2))-methyltransferase RsmD [Moraxella
MKKPTKPHHKATNQVRIIGGQFKRRSISFVDADGLRPTPDRLRETLFNWLMADIHDAKVLDVCAGSGVLGFEALSRGASHVVMIEPSPTQAHTIEDNADSLKLTRSQLSVINDTAQTALPTLGTPFDVIFIDPPYALDIWHDIISGIIEHGLYHADTLCYIESNTALDDILTPFCANLFKSTKIGQVHAGLFTLPI